MSAVELTEVGVEQTQYVCFIKRRTGHRFVPYTEPGDSNVVVVKTLRQFLDHEIDRWYRAGKEEAVEHRAVQKFFLDEFSADVDMNGMNSKLVSMLG